MRGGVGQGGCGVMGGPGRVRGEGWAGEGEGWGRPGRVRGTGRGPSMKCFGSVQ